MAAKKKSSTKLARTKSPAAVAPGGGALVEELRGLIRQTREHVATAVNSTLVMLYWEVGQRIRTEILRNARADYGKQIVATVSRQLTVEFGRGFTEKGLWRMIQLAEVFPDRL